MQVIEFYSAASEDLVSTRAVLMAAFDEYVRA